MKRATSLLLLMALLGVVSMPRSVSALDTSALEGQLCSALSDRLGNIETKLDEQSSKYNAAKQERNNSRTERRGKLDQAILDGRAQADEARASAQVRLLDKQTTDKGKAAVEEYKTAVETAVAARRAAYNAARASFRQSVDGMSDGYTGGIDSRINTFKSAVNQAFTTASKSCGKRGQDLATTRRAFIDTLKNARLSYSDYRRNRQDTGELAKQYVTARNEAFKAATQTFQQSMRSARENLAAALNGQ